MPFALLLVLLAADPSQASVLLAKGLMALQQGRLPEARANLEEASQVDQTNPYVWSSLAETYWRLKLPQQASAAAASAEKFGSQDPIVSHALAMYFAESGNPAKAAAFETEFAESPKADPDAAARAAGLYLNAGETEQALELAKKAVAKSSSALSENVLGRALIASGSNADAASHLSAAWQMARTDSAIAFDYAQVLLREQKFDEAAQVIEPALEAHAGNAQLSLALGVVRYGQRKFEEAIQLFLQVIKADPRIEQPYVFIGKMLDQAGAHLPEITDDYRRWLRREPSNPRAVLSLAKALSAGGGDTPEVETLLRKSIALEPNDWESHYELGVLLNSKREFQAAADQLAKSTNLDPAQPMPHYQLARAYDRLGQPEKAKAEREIHARLVSGKTNPPAKDSEHQF